MDRYEIDLALLASDPRQRLAHRQPLTSDVYDVVMDMLMNHTLGPGSRLNIDQLARLLGVSPTPVREALARVESEGLVTKAPHAATPSPR
jgi:DNA-binding GntR family transcriptional regulator